jgi:phage shock protein A
MGHPESEGLYANAFNVDGDEDVVVLEFGYSHADHAGPAHSRIVTSLEHATLLSNTLRNFLRSYEKAAGRSLDDNDDDDAARKSAPTGRRTTMQEHHDPSKSGTYGGGGHQGHKPPPPCDDDQHGSKPEEPPRTPCGEDEYGGCVSPTDQVGILQAAYAKAQADLAALTKRQADFQADVSALESSAADQAAIVDAYKTSRKALAERKSALECWIHDYSKDIGCKVNGDELNQCIAGIKEWVDKWKAYQGALETWAETAATQAAQTAKAVSLAEEAYDEAKEHASGLDTTLQGLESLKASIKAKQDAGESCEAYILLQELSERLTEIELPAWRDFEHELCVAWTAFSDAKATARDAKGQADEAQAKFDDAKTFYDTISQLDYVWGAILQCCCKPKPTGDCKQAQS